jgi:CRP-like cAMP-binding protein
VASIDRLVLKLERRDTVSVEEKRVLESAVARIDSHAADEDVIVEGVPQTESRLQLDGVTCRYKAMSDGRRQIMELHFGGDFVDLHSFTLKHLDHNVGAITRVSFAIVPHAALREITETQPHLTRLLWFTTMLDAAVQREWVVSAGRRSAIGRMAHLFCELFVRLGIVGLTEGDRYPLPLTQEDMADVCGLTPVHVNRTLQELRARGAVEWQRGTVTIKDWPALQSIAEFDPAYLYLERQPR